MDTSLLSIKRQRGYSIFELLIALMIGLAVLSATLLLAPQGENAQKTQALVQEVVAIRAHMRELFPVGSNQTYGVYGFIGLNNELRPMLDPRWRGDGLSVYLGSPIAGTKILLVPAFWPTTGTPLYGDSYTIMLISVPAELCMSVVTQMATVVESVQIGGTDLYRAPDVPLNPSLAAQMCVDGPPQTINLGNT